MKQQKKTWQPVVYAFLFLLVVLLLFNVYTALNRSRIQEQNRVYAEDSARHTVKRIESEFDNALQRIENNAYLVSASGGAGQVDARVLKEWEDNTTFDAVRFTNKDGVNLASNGATSDSSDRNYFVSGMRGESGLETVSASRITGKPMMVFYSPVYDGEEISGMFLGLYFAEDYLRDMLGASYFGEPAEVFLCTKEGMVVANSGNGTYGEHLFATLTEEGVIDEETARAARSAFADGTDTPFFCLTAVKRTISASCICGDMTMFSYRHFRKMSRRP